MDSSPTPVPGTSPAWPSSMESGADHIGEVVDGRYRILRRLAKGGMAHVFLGKDLTRRCHVALKLLHRSGPESRRRFEVEAEVLSNIQHPHIVRPVAFGHTLDAQPFMALEYLEGETLSQRLARGPLPWREVAEFGAQIAGALHALHHTGVIHRDIKPDNIMIAIGADRAVAKLIDLGLASVGTPFHEAQDARFTSQVSQRHKTQLGRTIGTPAYLPPEAGLCDAEPRLDVYSLGATLYQLCTWVLPDSTDLRPIQSACPDSDAPRDLSRLLRAALAADVADRLPSADHLRRGLEAILAAHPRSPRPLFGGCYDRLEVIGVGASAVVYRASDRELSREVALKVLRDARPSEDDTLRFRRAAKILSVLRHPNIPRIHHFGVDRSDPAREEGQRFAVTELCPGSPASDFTRPDRHLRPDEVIAVGGQLASALAAVHAAGVVYRDLHVGNVLIARGERPQAWIFDFDHAQVSPEFHARLTERWATPPEEQIEPAHEKPLQRMDYAAPEVRAGAAYTTASDVFALGLLLYRLLTGLRPFPPIGGAATPARKVCRACPPGLEHLLLSMLNSRPDARPTLTTVQVTLEDEQAELEAEQEAEREETAAAGSSSSSAAVALTASTTAATLAVGSADVVAPSHGVAAVTAIGALAVAPSALSVAAHATESSRAVVPVDAPRAAGGAPQTRARLAAGLVVTLGLAVAWGSLRSGPAATQVAPDPAQVTVEPRPEVATAPPLVHLDPGQAREDVRSDMSARTHKRDDVVNDMSSKTHDSDGAPSPVDVQPRTVPEQTPALHASSVTAPADPPASAASTRPARPRKRDPLATWESRMRKAELRAGRCLDAAGVEPRRVVVTLSPGAPVEFGGVPSTSIHAQCIRDTLARLDLGGDARRRHTFFDAP